MAHAGARFISLAALIATATTTQHAHAADCTATSVGFTPLTEPGQGLYLGQFAGGLYELGSAAPPDDWRTRAAGLAASIAPLSAAGAPDPAGAMVFLSIGLSNTTQEFRAFQQLVASDARVRSGNLLILDGARGGQHTLLWDDPADDNYDRVRDDVLAPAGATESQVVAVWIKLANPRPSVSLPDAAADAFAMEAGLGDVVRAVQQRYPNARLAFLSSRIYAGYASTTLNPEPFAYESGFAVKWLIQAQIGQERTGQVDAVAGDLEVGARAPLLLWGPYLWADGLMPRADGLVWQCADLADDGTHPSPSGRSKVAQLLRDFLLRSPASQPWFSTLLAADLDMDSVVGPGDLLALLAAWGSCSGVQICAADIDGDGDAGPADLLALLASWGLGV